MHGIYKMKLATFYLEMNRSHNEQVVGVDLLAKIYSDLQKNQKQIFSLEKKIMLLNFLAEKH